MAKTLSKVLHQVEQLSSYDSYICLLGLKPGATSWENLYPESIDAADRQILQSLTQRDAQKPAVGSLLSFDRTPLQRWVVAVVDAEMETFRWLGLARQIVKPLKDHNCKRIVADLRHLPVEQALQACDALTAAAKALQFKFPKYTRKEGAKEAGRKETVPGGRESGLGGKDMRGRESGIDGKESSGKGSSGKDSGGKGSSGKDSSLGNSRGKDSGSKDTEFSLDLLVPAKLSLDHATRVVQHAESSSAANNQLRHLVMQAGNDLTPSRYVALLKKLAEQSELGFSFISQKKLEGMGAGAFIAVAQGSAHEDAGIVKLTYEANGKKGTKHLVLVGKGVTFDTGGHNLKNAAGMYGMHRDMAGSALAYSLIALAAKEKWPVRVTAFLAIAENAIGPQAYRQNDVVTALNGKTIEIVDTDAEGRMLLADTLHIASGEKPDLLLDFATLTGACIRSLSTIYSGVFSNRPELGQPLITAGRESGERVWPFPLDADFADCLKSDIADIKQCRVSGGVDHIEAALFLKEFVGKDIPWVHLDLSSAENTGGLAHVDTEVTGFGVRFVARFVRNYWGWSA